MAMAGEGSLIDHNNMISQNAIVCDMAISHEKIVVADYRRSPGLGAAVNRYKFADLIVAADFREGGFVFIRQVLRPVSDHGVHVDFIVAAHFRAAANHGPGMKNIVRAELDAVFDNDERPDDAVFA